MISQAEGGTEDPAKGLPALAPVAPPGNVPSPPLRAGVVAARTGTASITNAQTNQHAHFENEIPKTITRESMVWCCLITECLIMVLSMLFRSGLQVLLHMAMFICSSVSEPNLLPLLAASRKWAPSTRGCSSSFLRLSPIKISAMNELHAIKVILRNQEGNYLAGDFEHGEFTDDRAKARVFDYVQDRVREQLDSMRAARGSAWVAVRLDPREAYEICDRCGRRVMSFRALFDGARYLCDECSGK
jgi:hypothetical protein